VADQRGYARSDGAHLAYSVRGLAPPDLLYLNTYTVSLDSYAEEPHTEHYFRRLASFSRLIQYDQRGIGLSDPIDPANPPTETTGYRDATAVLDAVGVEHAAIVTEGGGVHTAVALAVAAPERVDAVVIVNGYARLIADDDYPQGLPRDAIEAFLEQNMDPDESWSTAGADDLTLIAPSLADDAQFRDWWQRASIRGASPASARAVVGAQARADVRALLPQVSARTLVIHRTGNRFVPPPLGRFVADHISGASYVELAGADQAAYAGRADELVDHIEDFLTGQRSGGAETVLATVLFTDIVDSTGRAAALGDRAWRTFLDTHDRIVRNELRRYGGQEVNTTGDGFMGTFSRPTQAVECAHAIVAALADQKIAVRAGVHTGECERRGDDFSGLTVHIAARVAALGASGEVLVSRTVCDLVTGSGLHFAPRGEHELKGVPGTWQLFALET
jgi:class 3 adenylate cyclase